MTRPTVLALVLALTTGVVDASGAPKPPPKSAAQQAADRHFKTGVARFKAGKFTEALAEFERAYEISPHPLVLYNIAGCYRELSRYREAVKLYVAAANADHGPSAKRLGDIYSGGKGDVPQDYTASLRWHQRARQLGEKIQVKGR